MYRPARGGQAEGFDRTSAVDQTIELTTRAQVPQQSFIEAQQGLVQEPLYGPVPVAGRERHHAARWCQRCWDRAWGHEHDRDGWHGGLQKVLYGRGIAKRERLRLARAGDGVGVFWNASRAQQLHHPPSISCCALDAPLEQLDA